MAVAADLVDAPVDLQPVIVGVAEFDRELATGAAAPREIDRDPVAAQMVAGADDLVEGGDLEGEVVELDIRRFRPHRADECDTVVVPVAAQKDYASRDHLLGIDVGDLE